MKDIWSWLYEIGTDDQVATVSELVDRLLDANRAQDSTAVASIGEQLIQQGDALNQPWLGVFARHWQLQHRLNDLSEGTTAVADAVSAFEIAHRDENLGCPQTICSAQDLCIAYSRADGPGHADAVIAACEDTLARIDSSWPCYDCVSTELFRGQLHAGRLSDGLETIVTTEVEIRRHGGTPALPYVSSRLEALLGLGRNDEALALATTFDEARYEVHSEWATIELQHHQARAHLRAGDRERAVALLREAGVPQEVLQLVQGDGAVGAALIALPGIEGVAFTGSTVVAKIIARTLADKDGPIVPLIAETGGQNAMIVDSTAMFEQVTDDVLRSAFGSAGQRCSALRILCVQDDIADELLPMIGGAMALLRVGDPLAGTTDVGPIIDAEALARLDAHCVAWAQRERYRSPLPNGLPVGGHYLAPRLIELSGIDQLTEEQFGPILHVVRYDDARLDELLAALDATGYGLTLGIHSRNTAFVEQVYRHTRAGNVYVNRNMTGAVVGVQPFGGTGLSGSGPKAGGPHYLLRFATERTLSDNVAAIGGNLDLLTDEQRAET